ncbi:zinc-binding dehydrogenase [Nocardia gipuzkoensis]|uniref:zinc-binding dehydrogenase n=1 Tax=Nocardia gipuzkoensis TaxID=2749991 RepID=UPI002FCE091F
MGDQRRVGIRCGAAQFRERIAQQRGRRAVHPARSRRQPETRPSGVPQDSRRRGRRPLSGLRQDLDPAEYRRNEDELAALPASGHVRPHIGAHYPLEQVAAALRHVADGRAIGKVVVEVARSDHT